MGSYWRVHGWPVRRFRFWRTTSSVAGSPVRAQAAVWIRGEFPSSCCSTGLGPQAAVVKSGGVGFGAVGRRGGSARPGWGPREWALVSGWAGARSAACGSGSDLRPRAGRGAWCSGSPSRVVGCEAGAGSAKACAVVVPCDHWLDGAAAGARLAGAVTLVVGGADRLALLAAAGARADPVAERADRLGPLAAAVAEVRLFAACVVGRGGSGVPGGPVWTGRGRCRRCAGRVTGGLGGRRGGGAVGPWTDHQIVVLAGF